MANEEFHRHRRPEILVGLLAGTPDTPSPIQAVDNKLQTVNYYWNPNTLAYVVSTGGGDGVGTEVKVTNTVPVSFAGGIDLSAGSLAALETISVANFPVTQAVTGTFWQATQPVSGTLTVNTGLTDTELRASAVPISLATAPTTPVTGTFWQTTQPISATNLDVALSTRLKPADTLTGITTLGSITNTVVTDVRRGQTLLFAVINAASSGDNTLIAADGTKKIKVLQYTLVATAAVEVIFKSGAATSLTGNMSLGANGGIASPFVAPGQGHLMETAVNQALVLNLSGAISVDGHLTYILEV